MRNIVVLAVLALIATGCVTAGEACVGYGFRPGTDAFAGCLQREAHHRENAWRSIHIPPPQPIVYVPPYRPYR